LTTRSRLRGDRSGMEEIVKVDSKQLQLRHPKVYQRLHEACKKGTVASAPCVISWSPPFAVAAGGVGAASKLPLRIYVGLQPLKENRFEWDVWEYRPEQDEFCPREPLSSVNHEHFQFLRQIVEIEGLPGAKMHVVCEVPWMRGLNVDPSIACAMAACWSVMAGKLTGDDLKRYSDYQTVKCEELSREQEFKDLFYLARGTEALIARTFYTDGHLVYASLVGSSLPVLFREAAPIQDSHELDAPLRHGFSPGNARATSHDVLAAVSQGFNGGRLHECFKDELGENPGWAFDAVLLYPENGRVDSQHVYTRRRQRRQALHDLQQLVGSHCWATGPMRTAATAIDGLLLVLADLVVKSLKDSFIGGKVLEFVEAERSCGAMYQILELSRSSHDRLAIKDSGAVDAQKLAWRYSGPGVGGANEEGGGCFLVIGEKSEYIRTCFDDDSRTQWASWRDGDPDRDPYGSDEASSLGGAFGVRVETPDMLATPERAGRPLPPATSTASPSASPVVAPSPPAPSTASPSASPVLATSPPVTSTASPSASPVLSPSPPATGTLSTGSGSTIPPSNSTFDWFEADMFRLQEDIDRPQGDTKFFVCLNRLRGWFASRASDRTKWEGIREAAVACLVSITDQHCDERVAWSTGLEPEKGWLWAVEARAITLALNIEKKELFALAKVRDWPNIARVLGDCAALLLPFCPSAKRDEGSPRWIYLPHGWRVYLAPGVEDKVADQVLAIPGLKRKLVLDTCSLKAVLTLAHATLQEKLKRAGMSDKKEQCEAGYNRAVAIL
jgi:hypothetical protein